MSLVFQDALSALNPVLTIGDQIGEMYRQHQGASRRQARLQSAEMLSLVGIPGAKARLDDYPHQFSGVMRQRLLIAMAIALEPELLIADEPTTALDVTVQAQILELLDRLRLELNMGVLLITHDLGWSARSPTPSPSCTRVASSRQPLPTLCSTAPPTPTRRHCSRRCRPSDT